MSELNLPGLTTLRRVELETLYRVGEILSRSLDFRHTSREILRALDEQAGMSRSMVSVLDPENGDLVVHAVNGNEDEGHESVRYQAGEGLLGLILEEKSTLALPRLGDEPRFLNRLGLYDRRLAFIAAPISLGGNLHGVLAVQPNSPDDGLLAERTRFVEMVASLIGQSIRLSLDVEREKKSIADERDSLRRTVRHQYGFDNIVGRSAPMRRVFDQVRMVSKWNTTVLLRGETGTGKELIANAIHYHSPRSNGAYVRLNCASLPENLLESELFGHEKGAFTGAVSSRRGRFESADGGTIFLDEIGDLPHASQVKLLRLVQEREYLPIGSDVTRKTDARIIAATNVDPATLGEPERFRSDLYYRLRAHHVHLPPLRERREDIPLLVDHFLRQACQQRRKPVAPPELFPLLMGYPFPGNIRELQFLVLDAVSCTTGETLDIGRIREHVAAHHDDAPAARPGEGAGVQFGPELPTLKRVCAELVMEAMRRTGGNQAMAAGMLGVSRQALNKRLNKLLMASEDDE